MNLLDQTGIVAQCALAERELVRAFQVARKGAQHARRNLSLLSPREAQYLRAVTPKAQRIWNNAFATAVISRLVDPNSNRSRIDVFLVTLCDVSCVTEIHDRSPPISRFKARLRKGIRGLSFIGAIEPGYYTNIQNGSRIKHTKCISWHLHVLAWGTKEAELRSIIGELNRSERYRAIAYDRAGAHCKKIKARELPETLGYVLKPPTVAYRLSMRTGKAGVESSKQGKSRLRPGERLDLFHAMKELTLPELALAGGEGVEILAEVKNVAWKACRRSQ